MAGLLPRVHGGVGAGAQGHPLMDRYLRHEEVGGGTYGVVFRARDLRTGREVAIKKILPQREEGIPGTAIREASILKSLSHPYIVALTDIVVTGSLYLVFEYVPFDLYKLLKRHPMGLNKRLVQRYTYQLLDALNFCHANRIIHRDLKPQNILVTEDMQTIKLADFGLARAFQVPMQTYTHEVVTLWYRAPEILLGASHYSPLVDVWSVGCLIPEMSAKDPLFPGGTEIEMLFKIFSLLGTPTEATWPGVTKLPDWKPVFPAFKSKPLSSITPRMCSDAKLMQLDPAKRVSAKDALSHPFLDDVRPSLQAATEAAWTA